MNISKTTFNYAKKRGLDLTINDFDDYTALCFWEADNDCEWMFSYRIEYGMLVWQGNIYLPQHIKEELPATITSEKQLRQMIDFVAKEISK